MASTRSLRMLARLAGVFTLAVAAVVFVGGWMGGVTSLKNVVPGTVEMKALTALGLASAAIALLLATIVPSRGRTAFARAAAGLPLMLGLAVLGEYTFGWELGIDELLFRDETGRRMGIAYPGRFAPTTAACLALSGLALLALDVAPRRGWRLAEVLVLPVFFLSGMTVIGYLYAIPFFYGPASAAKMALNTGVCFLCLAAGILLARPRGRLVRLAVTDDPGGVMLRRLLPVAVLLPLMLGWATLEAVDAGLYGARVGTWWLSAATVVALTLLTSRVAARLSVGAQERRVLQAELERLASRDSLTGLLNRRRFDEELAAAAARVARGGEPCSLAIIDFDCMKDVNDQLGHGAGDELLMAFGTFLARRIRGSDVGARIGGDEFALLLTDTTAAQARSLAEAVSEQMRTCRVATPRGDARTTVSIGLTDLSPLDSGVGAPLLRADEAMYAAKRTGGDGIVSRPAPPGVGTPVGV